MTSNLPVIAGPFTEQDRLSGIPTDKKLDPMWIKSLFQRGNPTTYRASRKELDFIGMPVGGQFTGTLYLGGDGRLWLWDIFNDNREGIEPKRVPWDTEVHAGKTIRSRDGAAYVAPAKDIRPVEQGFAFKISQGTKTWIKTLEKKDWEEIIFAASYPVANIKYVDKNLPVEIEAEVFTPFIPLNVDDSGLPLTLYRFRLKNISDKKIKVSIIGWLENKTGIKNPEWVTNRSNRTFSTEDGRGVIMQVSGKEDLLKTPDFGTMTIIGFNKKAQTNTQLILPVESSSFNSKNSDPHLSNPNEAAIGSVTIDLELMQGQTTKETFGLTWHFPNLAFKEIPETGRYYASKFKDAQAVAEYTSKNLDRLINKTLAFKNCWYDSTLPHWFLERTLINTSCLQTTTAHRMSDGRFYFWEGVGCCPGTCTHVWQYAQAGGRLFPAMEKEIRERIDLGKSLQPDGSMWYRCEADRRPAVDGQAGTILRFYREHLMSADDQFLRKNWPSIKKTIEFLMSLDKNGDGMEDTPVENTLDAMWGGEIAWIVGLCIAAVSAGEKMAEEAGDQLFAVQCKNYVNRGKSNMEKYLFNGEYFIHRPDEKTGRQKIGSYNTCHIDQVYGQSWAHQVGLGRILDRVQTLSALKALWKYNFTPDVGPYIKDHTGGRPYALAGEGGMIMNSNPGNEEKPYGDEVTWQMGYFHECMSGFEHQVASHMMAEGMIEEALVLTRMIHDRYHASKRNPFNEIECSDHYARAMASYGTFISACGVHYHGPKGILKVNPRLKNEGAFKAAFTTAEGWGTYSQEQTDNGLKVSIRIVHGKLMINELVTDLDKPSKQIVGRLNGKTIELIPSADESGAVHFNHLNISEGEELVVSFG